ncbi:MAG: hypothetical protein RLZZ528_1460 [Pseudomonadota bacterium]
MTTISDLDAPTAVRRFTSGLHLAAFVAVLTIGGSFVWAAFAPLATTLTIPGEVSADQPVAPVQHPSGGRIAAVLVREFDKVAKGQPLVAFDDLALAASRQMLGEQIALAEAQLAFVQGRPLQTAAAGAAADRALAELHGIATNQTAALARIDAEIALARAERAGKLTALQLSEDDLRRSLRQRDRAKDLALRGTTAAAEADRAAAEHLEREMLLADTRAALAASDQRLAVLHAQRQERIASHSADMQTRGRMAFERLVELRHRLSETERALTEAVLVAPIDGEVTSLPAIGPGQVFRPGELVAEVAGDLATPEVRLHIPARYADQVNIGQKGRILVPSLPQRDMPAIGVTVSGLSAAPAQQAEATGPLSYTATASIDAGDLDTARALLGESFRLRRGLPVVVLLEGRPMTPLSYVVGPFFSFARRAFEAG